MPKCDQDTVTITSGDYLEVEYVLTGVTQNTRYQDVDSYGNPKPVANAVTVYTSSIKKLFGTLHSIQDVAKTEDVTKSKLILTICGTEGNGIAVHIPLLAINHVELVKKNERNSDPAKAGKTYKLVASQKKIFED